MVCKFFFSWIIYYKICLFYYILINCFVNSCNKIFVNENYFFVILIVYKNIILLHNQSSSTQKIIVNGYFQVWNYHLSWVFVSVLFQVKLKNLLFPFYFTKIFYKIFKFTLFHKLSMLEFKLQVFRMNEKLQKKVSIVAQKMNFEIILNLKLWKKEMNRNYFTKRKYCFSFLFPFI